MGRVLEMLRQIARRIAAGSRPPRPAVSRRSEPESHPWVDVRRVERRSREPKPVWCLVANIGPHPFGPNGRQVREDTKHFSAGTKVYCFPPQWGDGYKKVQVIAHHRGSPRLVTAIIPAKVLTDCRAKLVYRPAVIERFEGQWDGSDKSRKLAEELAAMLIERRNSQSAKG